MKHNGVHSRSFLPSTTVEVVLCDLLALQLQKTIITKEDMKGLVLVKAEKKKYGFPPTLSLQDCGLRNGDVVQS